MSFWETTTGKTLRWIGVLPVGLAMMVVMSVFAKIVDFLSPVDSSETWIMAAEFAVSGWAIVRFGTQTAPSYKQITAIVLAVLCVCFCSGLFFLSLVSRDASYAWWQVAIMAVVGIVSSVGTCVYEHENRK